MVELQMLCYGGWVLSTKQILFVSYSLIKDLPNQLYCIMTKTKIALLLSIIYVGFVAASYSHSSMAKLMKQMLAYIKNEKTRIDNNQPILAFPFSIQKLNKAKVHKGKKISENHQQYMDDFSKELNVYESSTDPTLRKSAFNSLVSSCVSCHKHECPGPIPVIEKQFVR